MPSWHVHACLRALRCILFVCRRSLSLAELKSASQSATRAAKRPCSSTRPCSAQRTNSGAVAPQTAIPNGGPRWAHGLGAAAAVACGTVLLQLNRSSTESETKQPREKIFTVPHPARFDTITDATRETHAVKRRGCCMLSLAATAQTLPA